MVGKPEDVALCIMCHKVTYKEKGDGPPYSHTEVSRCAKALTLRQYIVEFAKTLIEDAVVAARINRGPEADCREGSER